MILVKRGRKLQHECCIRQQCLRYEMILAKRGRKHNPIKIVFIENHARYEMILVKRGRKQLDIHDDVVGMLGYEMILD